jgi:hypothetical protein
MVSPEWTVDRLAVFEGDRWTIVAIKIILANLGTCIHLGRLHWLPFLQGFKNGVVRFRVLFRESDGIPVLVVKFLQQ